jgi:hypothetical protein
VFRLRIVIGGVPDFFSFPCPPIFGASSMSILVGFRVIDRLETTLGFGGHEGAFETN